MITRSGRSYVHTDSRDDRKKRRRNAAVSDQQQKNKKKKPSNNGGCLDFDFFEALPDDLVLSILCKLSSSASSPADFISILITCKRMNGLGLDSLVLSKASTKLLVFRAKKWSESAHRFLISCTNAGNIEAFYTLGMIRFYCLNNRGNGASLMARAAINSHAPALYSLSVIKFNGSGGSKDDKDLRAGVALCARAAFLGHIDALRELGHCLQDGYGVKQNISEGRRFLIQANARELAVVLSNVSGVKWLTIESSDCFRHVAYVGCPLLNEFGSNVPAPEIHPVNRFLKEWYGLRNPDSGLRICSHSGCGRPETRRHEFRRCSVCGSVHYCSRACQALDWKMRHKAECTPVERWAEEEGGEIENDDGGAANYEDAGMQES